MLNYFLSVHVYHKTWAEAIEVQVEKIDTCTIFLVKNKETSQVESLVSGSTSEKYRAKPNEKNVFLFFLENIKSDILLTAEDVYLKVRWILW